MNKINFKQKAIEYSIGILLGFLILFFFFNDVIKTLNYNFNIMNRIIYNNQLQIKHNNNTTEELNLKVDSLSLKQDSTIEKLHQINDGIKLINKKIDYLDKIRN